MSELRAAASGLGFKNPRTLVATGNLIFEADSLSIPEIETMLEAEFENIFGKHVDIIVRKADAWLKLTAGNPFVDRPGSDVVVRVMRPRLDDAVVDMLRDYAKGPERIAIIDGDLWVDFVSKPSLSRLLPALTTKRLGVGTLRNWNTVQGLARMLVS